MATKRDIDRFKKMTNPQKRVAICKDVLLQLDLGVYDAGSVYFVAYDDEISNSGGMITHESIRGRRCSLCAKGALMVSRFGKFNALGEFEDQYAVSDFASELGDNLPEFPKSMANDIENAFESCLEEVPSVKRQTDKVEWSNDEIIWKQINIWNNYPAEDRLRIICANIIRNKGAFKPLELLDYEVTEV